VNQNAMKWLLDTTKKNNIVLYSIKLFVKLPCQK